MIEPAPLASKLTGSKEIRHAALPVKKAEVTCTYAGIMSDVEYTKYV